MLIVKCAGLFGARFDVEYGDGFIPIADRTELLLGLLLYFSFLSVQAAAFDKSLA